MLQATLLEFGDERSVEEGDIEIGKVPAPSILQIEVREPALACGIKHSTELTPVRRLDGNDPIVGAIVARYQMIGTKRDWVVFHLGETARKALTQYRRFTIRFFTR